MEKGLLSVPALGTGDTESEAVAPIFWWENSPGFRLSCVSSKAKIQKVQIQCWQQQAVPALEEDGAVEICRQRILEDCSETGS